MCMLLFQTSSIIVIMSTWNTHPGKKRKGFNPVKILHGSKADDSFFSRSANIFNYIDTRSLSWMILKLSQNDSNFCYLNHALCRGIWHTSSKGMPRNAYGRWAVALVYGVDWFWRKFLFLYGYAMFESFKRRLAVKSKRIAYVWQTVKTDMQIEALRGNGAAWNGNTKPRENGKYGTSLDWKYVFSQLISCKMK